jgi:hypothetical protein
MKWLASRIVSCRQGYHRVMHVHPARVQSAERERVHYTRTGYELCRLLQHHAYYDPAPQYESSSVHGVSNS